MTTTLKQKYITSLFFPVTSATEAEFKSLQLKMIISSRNHTPRSPRTPPAGADNCEPPHLHFKCYTTHAPKFVFNSSNLVPRVNKKDLPQQHGKAQHPREDLPLCHLQSKYTLCKGKRKPKYISNRFLPLNTMISVKIIRLKNPVLTM